MQKLFPACALLAVLASAAAAPKRAGTDWWSLQPLGSPAVPSVADASWCWTEADRFILAKLEKEGLKPAPDADRRRLLRRLTFDLTGLPPTPDEMAAFLADTSPEAVPKLIDRLLASPAYGEKWARLWLDVARFGESDGFEFDKPRPHAWRFRDWVIRALNADLPYDQFVRWQLAGDVLEPENADAVTAAAFLVCGPYDDTNKVTASENLRKVMRQDELEDVIGTVGQAFLGLTLHCARCHDHKFDPVSSAEYYQIASCFAGLQRGNRKLPGMPAAGEVFTVLPGAAPSTAVLDRGNPLKPGPVVAPGALRCLSAPPADFGLAADAPEAARRRALADWITHRQNALFARTIVNRVWHWHFGRGLVPTPSDLGFNGGAPSHPELLDWLARWFLDQGCSLKRLHRLMVSSRVFCQASGPLPPQDQENRWLSRQTPRRLQAEELRDAMLAVAGALNAQPGGESFQDFRMENIANTMHYHAEDRDAPEVNRRTVYRMWARGGANALLASFDCPDASVSTPSRPVTTTPINALSLLNSRFTFAMAARLAKRLELECGADAARQIARLHQLALARSPSDEEAAEAAAFSARHGMAALCRVVFNASEFIVID